MTNTQFPIPNTQYPTPNTQYPIPNTQHTQHPIPTTRSPMPNPQHPIPRTQSPTPNTQLPLPPRTLPQLGAEPEPVPGLVLGYFGAALAWYFLATVGLVRLAPDLAHGLAAMPATVAVVHALSLGMLGSAVFGALHQFIPAVTGVKPRSVASAMAGFVLVQLGVALLVAGFLVWSPPLQAAGWTLLLPGIGAASWNTLPARSRATRNHPIATAVLLGHGALAAALLLGLARIGDGLGWWHTSRDAILLAHLHLGIAGFGTVTALGVTGAMLPAFLESRSRGPFPSAIAWVATLGLGILTAGALTTTPLLIRAGGALLFAALALYGILLGRVFHSRTRPVTGSVAFFLAAFLCLVLALGIGFRLLVAPTRDAALWIAYVVLGLPGWIGLLILGVMHQVAPRLLTLRRARRAPAGVALSRATFTPEPRVAWLSAALAAAGVLVLASGVLLGDPRMTRGGALLMVAGSLTVILQGAIVLGVGSREWGVGSGG